MKIKPLIIVLLGTFSAGPSLAAGSHAVRGHVSKKGT